MWHLLVSTRNAHKAREIQDLLQGLCRLSTLVDFPEAPVVIEDQPTFAGNAIKKAVQLASWLYGRGNSESITKVNPISRIDAVIADDSGLEVDALQGAPGVHSARFANLESSTNSSDAANNGRLLELMRHVPPAQRSARFRCVIALCPVDHSLSVNSPDSVSSRAEIFEGICEGAIHYHPRGTGGFGYDPLFVPNGYSQTYAELGEAIKNTISHRADAIRHLRQRLESSKPFPRQ